MGLVEDTDTLFVEGADAVTLTEDDFEYIDQYGVEKDAQTFAFEIEDSEGATAPSVTFDPAAADADEYSFTARVLDGDTVVDEFEFELTVFEEADVDEVKVSEIGTLYATTTDAQVALYESDVELTGIVNGKEVVMPSDIEIDLQLLGGNLDSTGVATAPAVYAEDWAEELDEDTTYTRTVLATFDFDGTKTMVQEVVVDTTLPTAEAITPVVDEDEGTLVLEGNVLTITVSTFANISNFFDTDGEFYFELENQYGVHDSEDVSYIYYTVEDGDPDISIDNADENVGDLTVTSVADGDEVSVTAVTDSGLTSTVIIKIVADEL
jgi:hypothetical protein